MQAPNRGFLGGASGYLKSFDKFVLSVFSHPKTTSINGQQVWFVLVSVMNFLESQPCFERKQLEALVAEWYVLIFLRLWKAQDWIWSSKNPGISDMY